MKNEILEELWKVKDEIAHENKYDVKILVKKLKKKQTKKPHNKSIQRM